jgi:heptosyltransferase III
MNGRILVIRGGAIGDFIVTLPVLRALRNAFPGVHLEVLGYPHIAELALAGGLVDAVKPIDSRPLASFFARGGSLPDALADYFAGFHLVLSFLYDPDQIFRLNVARVTEAQFIQGPHRPDEQTDTTASAQFLVPLQKLGIFDSDPVPQLTLSAAPPSGRLALHPGSGSVTKNWPASRWEELLERLLADADMTVQIVGGEAEGGLLERLAANRPQERLVTSRNLPLTELARVLAGCRAFVGHDSGISHLAAAVGLPTLALWGPTREVLWRPGGAHVTTLRHANGLEALPVEVVHRAITELWSGQPGIR